MERAGGLRMDGRGTKTPSLFFMSLGPGRGRVKGILLNLNVKLFEVARMYVIVLDKKHVGLKILARKVYGL